MNCGCEVTLRLAVSAAPAFDAYEKAYREWLRYLHEGCQCERLAAEQEERDLAQAFLDPDFAFDLAVESAESRKAAQCEAAWQQHRAEPCFA